MPGSVDGAAEEGCERELERTGQAIRRSEDLVRPLGRRGVRGHEIIGNGIGLVAGELVHGIPFMRSRETTLCRSVAGQWSMSSAMHAALMVPVLTMFRWSMRCGLSGGVGGR